MGSENASGMHSSSDNGDQHYTAREESGTRRLVAWKEKKNNSLDYLATSDNTVF